MKNAVVYVSVTGNTKELAEAIKDKVGAEYCGNPCEEAMDATTIYIGFWATRNSCNEDIKEFIEKLSDKRIFLFGTAGYNNTNEHFKEILDNVKALVPPSNTIVGTFMCQGEVADKMEQKIKELKPQMYEEIKDKLDEAEGHPNENDIEHLLQEVNKINS